MSLNESHIEADALMWFGELGYPLDLQEEVAQTVLMQTELLCADGPKSAPISL